jgi:predicted Fe-S protein YdhL (DUF1289 family)
MKSPCTKVCTLRDGVCIGCGRNLNEIANWSKYTTEERSNILGRLSRIHTQKPLRSLPTK